MVFKYFYYFFENKKTQGKVHVGYLHNQSFFFTIKVIFSCELPEICLYSKLNLSQ